MMRVSNASLDSELLRALEADTQLAFKPARGKYLSGGTCPNCGKRELFVAVDKPYFIN
jgi:hypothetical protein